MTFIFYISHEWDSFNKKDFIIKLSESRQDDNFIIINRPKDFSSFFLNYKNYLKKRDEIKKETKIRKVSENLVIFRPSVLFHDLIGGGVFKARLNRFIFRQIYCQLLRARLVPKDDETLVLWLYSQLHWPFIKAFKKCKNKKVIWEIYDDYRLRSDGKKRMPYIKAEPYLLRQTDTIFTLTNGLKEKYKDRHSNVHVIGNGYDSNLFNADLNDEIIENEIMRIPYPRIAYIGVIRNWIDFDLLSRIILKRKEWSFIFIGPIDRTATEQMRLIDKYENVFILGKKKKERVGHYMKNVDVGLIPYIRSDFTKNVKPIKLYEFLATGTPVITSTSADIAECKGALYIFNNDFEEKIIRCLEETDVLQCIELSKNWSWESLIQRNVNPFIHWK